LAKDGGEVVSFTLWRIWTIKNPHFASKMLGESKRQFGHLGEEKSAIPARYQSLGLLPTLTLFDF
jgi:hypothetical protein